MSDWGWVILGWLLVAAVVGLYSMRLVVRGRTMTKAVPPDERRWMS